MWLWIGTAKASSMSVVYPPPVMNGETHSGTRATEMTRSIFQWDTPAVSFAAAAWARERTREGAQQDNTVRLSALHK